jgi:hypothetical protein
MPSANDGDEFYTILRKTAYDLLEYILKTNGAVPVLAGYLRNDVNTFQQLFFCRCDDEKVGP